LRPDGKPLEILGEESLDYLSYVDALLQIVAKNWAEIGVKFTPKFEPFDVLNSRYVANEQDIGIWNSDGGSEALPVRPIPFASNAVALDGCRLLRHVFVSWRQWLDSSGKEGIEPLPRSSSCTKTYRTG
jgi:ABC-type transport system substrate-binding protein